MPTTVFNTHAPNYCANDGYDFAPPPETNPPPLNRAAGCLDKVVEAAASAAACGLAVAVAIDSGGFASVGTAIQQCSEAARDGVEAYNACK